MGIPNRILLGGSKTPKIMKIPTLALVFAFLAVANAFTVIERGDITVGSTDDTIRARRWVAAVTVENQKVVGFGVKGTQLESDGSLITGDILAFGLNARRAGTVQNALVAVGFWTGEVTIDGDFDPSNNQGSAAAAGIIVGFNELFEFNDNDNDGAFTVGERVLGSTFPLASLIGTGADFDSISYENVTLDDNSDDNPDLVTHIFEMITSDGVFAVRFICASVPITFEGVTITPDMLKIDVEIVAYPWGGTNGGNTGSTGDIAIDGGDKTGFFSWRRSLIVNDVEVADAIGETNILTFGAGGGANDDNGNQAAGGWGFTIRVFSFMVPDHPTVMLWDPASGYGECSDYCGELSSASALAPVALL